MYIVVLGGGISFDCKLPRLVLERLNKAIELYKHENSRVIVSGKYSFLFTSKKPNCTEAQKMLEYLVENGVRKQDVIKEERSRDTIGNAYYLKKLIFIPKNIKSASIITSNYHIKRAKYIFQKVFGGSYKMRFIPTQGIPDKKTNKEVDNYQNSLILKTKKLLSTMKNGDHNFLKGKLYKLKFYRQSRPKWVIDFATKGI